MTGLIGLDEPWYRIDTDDNGTAQVHIYGVIVSSAWWDDEVGANELVKALDQLDAERIHLRINSPGGSVYGGTAIMNALARNSARVVASIDGIAASAATIIMLAADEIEMGAGAELMIHDASAIVYGQAKDLRKEADSLDRLSQTIAELYAKRAGGTAEQWRAAMLDETWYTAKEALAAGLVDRVLELPTPNAEPENVVPIERAAKALGWQHAGRSASSAPYIPAAEGRSRVTADDLARLERVALAAPSPADPPSASHPETKGVPTMSEKITKGLRERLGLTAEVDDEAMLTALDERLNAEPAAREPAATPEGVTMIDEDQLAALRRDAADGREAREAQRTAERVATVDAAVNTGRIPPARREHWLQQLEADPGAAETLNSLAAGTVPLEAKGITGGVDEAPDDDTEMYMKFWPGETPATDTTKGA
ncbi:head maturation protease, ClpP-related [Microbacterium excoecariae]|uniref:head maturation protease, ClpP-related n=1 Tax=Microbacterium excoecariae TaxID=2715210 RepID=UPI00140B63F8|nr:head maturation protease, ClpP-related [Microbacterium excoecariae]NHI16857.1 hypothetical protein [Microbacterium excoecariae]